MAVNPLPPQAYTKETLQKAYSWLLTQNSTIKEMASSQDMLISLYLKAQRSGDASLETPSIQNFKQELKSLANLIGDLQTPQQPPQQNIQNQQHVQQQTQVSQFNLNLHPPQQPIMAHQPLSAGNTQPIYNALPQSQNILQQLDQMSLLALAEVRETLNLGSDTEALRALIALGYKVFKKI